MTYNSDKLPDSKMSDPIFIIGHPKSGTSLLTALLDGHPQLCVVPEETNYYKTVWPKIKSIHSQFRLNKREKTERVINSVIEKSDFWRFFKTDACEDISGNIPYQDLSKEKFKVCLAQKITSINSQHRRGILLAVFSAFAETLLNHNGNPDLSSYVEKTPDHTWHLPAIIEDFPTAKFLFVFRDPRDNYTSYKKKHIDWLTPVRFSKAWLSALSEAEKLSPNQCYFVKYEELVTTPISVLEHICDHLSINFDQILLQPTKLGLDWYGNSMFGGRKQGIQGNSIGRFTSYQPAEEILIVEQITQAKAFQHGYEFPKKGNLPASVKEEFKTATNWYGQKKWGFRNQIKQKIRALATAFST